MNSELSPIFHDAVRGKPVNQDELENLLEKFPYCQSFHSIKAAQKKGTADFKAALQKAALYAPQRSLLYQLINNPQSLIIEAEVPVDPEAYFEPVASTVSSGTNDELSIVDEITGEITEPEQAAVEPSFAETESVLFEPMLPEIQEETTEGSKEAEAPDSIFDNIASSDYFVFNNSTVDPLTGSSHEEQASHKEIAVIPDASVSRYNDDKLPYTFLWWLQKTRKEYGGTYQPYVPGNAPFVSPGVKKNFTDELNQQIIENIFQSQVPLKEEQREPDTLKHKKEEELIEKFIQEEPQIKPPKPDKLDTENKARKSSEDHFDLVSETLAHIYIDQMLYHKAIDTYKKLSLKFPEKSTYFAAQIVELEKKIS